MSVYNIMDFGAVGDGVTSCTESIKKAIKKCADNGGGKIYVPAGKFLTGAIFLESDMNLYLEAGATLLFSNDIEEYQGGKVLKGNVTLLVLTRTTPEMSQSQAGVL